MAFTRAEAFAPATVANLGVGFDILGLALVGMGDRAVVEFQESPEIVITDIEGDDGKLPREADKNVASVSARTFLEHLGEKRGVKMKLVKGLPLSSGLGSSAASAVVSVMALNKLYGEPFTREQLLPFCLEGEALVSGYHADNVAPCLLGGITLVAGITVDAIQPLPIPDNLHLALATPEVAVPTAQARAVLPPDISLNTLVYQTGKVARLVDALHRGDLPALAEAMENDRVVEPARAGLMPLLDEIRTASKRAGAAAVFIGGAGPTLCAVCDNEATSKRVAETMKMIYQSINMNCIAQATRVDRRGSVILSAE